VDNTHRFAFCEVGLEPQRRVVVEGCDEKDLSDALHPQDHLAAFGCEMKRGNLYAEQGKIGDERWSGAL